MSFSDHRTARAGGACDERRNVVGAPTRYAVAFALTLLLWFSLAALVPARDAVRGDSIHYVNMSLGDFSDVPPPFRFRILTPALASLFKDHTKGFRIINEISIILASFLLFVLLSALGFSFGLALLGIVFFWFSYLGVYYHWMLLNVDHLSLLFCVLGFLVILRGRDLWFSLVLALGVLNRETALLLSIVHLVYRRSAEGLSWSSALKRTLLVSLPALALFAAVRVRGVLPPYVGPQPPAGFWGYIRQNLLAHLPAKGGVRGLLQEIVDTWGALWFLAALGWKKSHELVRKSIWFVVLTLPTLAATDTGRMLAPLFPVVIPASLTFIRDEVLRWRRWVRAAAIAVVVVAQFMWGIWSWFTTGTISRLTAWGLGAFVTLKPAFVLVVLFSLLAAVAFGADAVRRKKEFAAAVFALVIVVLVRRDFIITYEKNLIEPISGGARAIIQGEDTRTLADFIALLNNALRKLGVKNPTVERETGGFVWFLHRGDAYLYVELVPTGGDVLLFIHAPIAVLPSERDKLVNAALFLLRENELAQTGPAKFFIKDNAFSVGTVRPLPYLEESEVLHLIDVVGAVADLYNDKLAGEFGCEPVVYTP